MNDEKHLRGRQSSVEYVILGVLLVVGVIWIGIQIGSNKVSTPSFTESQFIDGGEIYGNIPNKAEFTFQFRNDTDETITLDDVNPSCSCTDYDLSTKELAPGEEAILSATMKLNQSGQKSAKILLTWSTGLKTTLQMHATAIPEQQFSMMRRYFRLDAGDSEEISVTYTSILEDETLPDITVDSVEGVTVDFGKWQVVTPANASIHSAARYLCTGHISADRHFSEAVVFPLRVGDLQETKIYVSSKKKILAATKK